MRVSVRKLNRTIQRSFEQVQKSQADAQKAAARREDQRQQRDTKQRDADRKTLRDALQKARAGDKREQRERGGLSD